MHAGPLQHQAKRADRKAFLAVLAVGLLAFAVVMFFVPEIGPRLKIYRLPTSSMAPGLPRGSHVTIDKAAYGYSAHSFDWIKLPISGRWPARYPVRGDVAAFRIQRAHSASQVYLKRIVGLPGDRIQMIAGRLHINGTKVSRSVEPPMPGKDALGKVKDFPVWKEQLPDSVSYKVLERAGDKSFLDQTAEFIVPAGHYFFMGDNRDNSVDSRIALGKGGVGMVAWEQLIGKVVSISTPSKSAQ